MTQPIIKREERNNKHCNSSSVYTSAAIVWIILGISSAMSLSTTPSSSSLLFSISLVKCLCSNAIINSASFKLSSYRPFLGVDNSQDRMLLSVGGLHFVVMCLHYT